MDRQQALDITGGLSHTTKMPCASFSLPSHNCAFGVQQGWVKIKNSICAKCYARKGRYLFPNVKKCLEKRLAGIQHPLWVEAMIFLINEDKSDYFRWHDSGEVVDGPHLLKIMEVVEGTPHKKHWLPTKQLQLLQRLLESRHGKLPDNLTVRASSPLCDCKPNLQLKYEGFPGVNSCCVSKDRPAWFLQLSTSKVCPAIAEHTGKCGDCRACWDRSVECVLYPQH